MANIPPAAQVLIDFKPNCPHFVGIDSDGCTFDAMELKQKECFTPNTIRVWGLQPISKYARETAEWVNLYSKWQRREPLARAGEAVRAARRTPGGASAGGEGARR